MTGLTLRISALLILFCTALACNSGQKPDRYSAIGHLQDLARSEEATNLATLAYYRALAHSDDPDFILGKLETAIEENKQATDLLEDVEPYQGDARLRDATIEYFAARRAVLLLDLKGLKLDPNLKMPAEAYEAYRVAMEANEIRMLTSVKKFQEETARFDRKYDARLYTGQNTIVEAINHANAVKNYASEIQRIASISDEERREFKAARKRFDTQGVKESAKKNRRPCQCVS